MAGEKQFNGAGTALSYTAIGGAAVVWSSLIRTVSLTYATDAVDFATMGSGRLGDKQQSAFANMTIDIDGLLLFGTTIGGSGTYVFTFMDKVTINATSKLVTGVEANSVLTCYGFSTNFSLSVENDTEATFSLSLQIVKLAADSLLLMETESPYHPVASE